jgi:hypothetical protein
MRNTGQKVNKSPLPNRLDFEEAERAEALRGEAVDDGSPSARFLPLSVKAAMICQGGPFPVTITSHSLICAL